MKLEEYYDINLTPKSREYYEEELSRYREMPWDPLIYNFWEVATPLSEYIYSSPYTQCQRDKLKEAIKSLSKKQREILELHLQGLKQVEIAERLGCCQSSIQKTLYGNWDYKRNRRHGGIIKKLKKLIKGMEE